MGQSKSEGKSAILLLKYDRSTYTRVHPQPSQINGKKLVHLEFTQSNRLKCKCLACLLLSVLHIPSINILQEGIKLIMWMTSLTSKSLKDLKLVYIQRKSTYFIQSNSSYFVGVSKFFKIVIIYLLRITPTGILFNQLSLLILPLQLYLKYKLNYCKTIHKNKP